VGKLFSRLFLSSFITLNTDFCFNSSFHKTKVKNKNMTNRHLTNELEAKRNSTKEEVDVAEERLKYLFTSSPVVIYCCRPSGDYSATFISETITSQLGYEAHEFIEDPGFWADKIHPEDKLHVFAGLPDLFEKGYYTHEYRFLHKDGRYRWMHDQLKLIRDSEGNPIEIVGFWMDITDRKKMEEALRESEDKYRTIFETTETATAIIDEDTTILLANAEFEKLCGYSKKEIECKKSWTEFVRQEDLERMKEYHRLRRIDPNAAPKSYEFGFIERGGNLKDIHLSIAMIPGTQKSVVSLSDITEIKRVAEALQESEKRYRLLAENLTDVIWTMDMNLRYTYVSPSVEGLRGYSVEEVMAQSIEEVLTPASLEVAKKVFAEVLSTEQREERRPFSSRTLELELRRKDGSTVWTEVKMNFLRAPDGRPVEILGVTRDITERKRAEETLRESEERLHLLSSNLLIAQETERKRISIELHDELGQALIALKLRLSSIRRKLRKDQKVLRDECEYSQGSIEQIIENVRRLSQDLSPYLLENLGLTAALRRLIDDLARDHKVETSIDIADIDNSLSQKRQLIVYRIFQEALTNIRRHAQATRISVAIKKEKDNLSFLVEDDGKGFDAKQAIAGNFNEKGLGLASMEERVRMLGGFLDIWSEVGKGTRISFTIPVIKEGIFEETSLSHRIGR
jgi:PAS domain S-box-containing protein